MTEATIPCPKCWCPARLQYGGERGEAGSHIYCEHCYYDEESEMKKDTQARVQPRLTKVTDHYADALVRIINEARAATVPANTSPEQQKEALLFVMSIAVCALRGEKH